MAYVQIIAGSLLGAAAYPMFLVPHSVAPGGLTGVATVLNHLFATPVGVVSLLMNVPLFIIGYRSMGRVFAIRSLWATILFSLLIDTLPLPRMTDDVLLSSVSGGALLGVGLGLILRGGATTGGSDMAARMAHARFPHISVGAILFAIDFIVVLASGVLIEASFALYAFISIYVSSKVIDAVLQGFKSQKACYVITEKHEIVMAELMEQLNRGVTVINARGGYSGQERPMLLCILGAREVMRLKMIVRLADENAFVFITDAHEVLGEGFSKLSDG